MAPASSSSAAAASSSSAAAAPATSRPPPSTLNESGAKSLLQELFKMEEKPDGDYVHSLAMRAVGVVGSSMTPAQSVQISSMIAELGSQQQARQRSSTDNAKMLDRFREQMTLAGKFIGVMDNLNLPAPTDPEAGSMVSCFAHAHFAIARQLARSDDAFVCVFVCFCAVGWRQ